MLIAAADPRMVFCVVVPIPLDGGRMNAEGVLRRIPPLDWQRLAPLFRPEWEHPAES